MNRNDINSVTSCLEPLEKLMKQDETGHLLAPSKRGTKELENLLKPYSPLELFEWLKVCDGIRMPGTVGGTVYGVEGRKKSSIPSIHEVVSTYDDWPRKDLIPIASDMAGQFYCLVGSEYDDETGTMPVAYVDSIRLDRVEFYVASSLCTLFKGMIRGAKDNDFEWYMNKKDVLKADPKIKKLNRSLLPWESDTP